MIFAMRSQTFRRMVQIPLMIAETATIRADEDGLNIALVDTAHIMMAGLTIPRSAMTQYEEPETITVDLKKLADIAKLADKDEDILAVVKDGHIMLTFGNITRRTAILDGQSAPPKIPNIPYTCQFTLGADVLASAVRAVADVGDVMTVDLREDGLVFSSRQDIDEAEYAAVPDSRNGACRSGYPMTYVQMIPRIASSGVLIADLGKEMPIRVSFDDGTLSGYVMLQPTVEHED